MTDEVFREECINWMKNIHYTLQSIEAILSDINEKEQLPT